MRVSIPTATIKFFIGWVAVFLFRLLPWRAPNFEPMLSTVMPFSKRFGVVGSFLFGFLGIVLFDAITSGWGSWTAVTALAYGTLGVGAHYFFSSREATVANFLTYGIPATIAYDAVTMLIGPVLNAQPLSLAIAGQIPFTLMHLAGTITFSILLSPILYRWVVANESIQFSLAAAHRAN